MVRKLIVSGLIIAMTLLCWWSLKELIVFKHYLWSLGYAYAAFQVLIAIACVNQWYDFPHYEQLNQERRDVLERHGFTKRF